MLAGRLFAVASWGLIVLFGFLAVAHVVLTVLFYTGVTEQGYGYFLDFEWPSWLITALDALVVSLVFFVRRERSVRPWTTLGATVLAAVVVVGRTVWMIFPPVFVAILLLDAVWRLAAPPSAS